MKKLLLLFLIVCCISCNKLEEGQVIKKWYEPTNTYIIYNYYYINKSMITIPYIVVDNEDWVVKIKGTYEGKERVETVYITKEQYECLSVGSHLKLTEDCSTSDDNND